MKRPLNINFPELQISVQPNQKLPAVTRLAINDNRVKVVDVRPRGSRYDKIVERGKEVIAVVVRLVRECIHR